MKSCENCGNAFTSAKSLRRFCSTQCRIVAYERRIRSAPDYYIQFIDKKCINCNCVFSTNRSKQIFCSDKCSDRVQRLCYNTKQIQKKIEKGSFSFENSCRWRGPYTTEEIAALRADPLCVLPNRTLRGQWLKCLRYGIPRDPSLFVKQGQSTASILQQKSRKRSPDRDRRAAFRRRARQKPEPILAELRQLARGHHFADDIVIEGFATVLRLAIPPAEAFTIAKAEVNRTSAQPFRDQSFNPEIDYEARETGRQVPRVSEIRTARGEG